MNGVLCGDPKLRIPEEVEHAWFKGAQPWATEKHSNGELVRPTAVDAMPENSLKNEERDVDEYISNTAFYTYRRSDSRPRYYKERRRRWNVDGALGDEDDTWARKIGGDVALVIHTI